MGPGSLLTSARRSTTLLQLPDRLRRGRDGEPSHRAGHPTGVEPCRQRVRSRANDGGDRAGARRRPHASAAVDDRGPDAGPDGRVGAYMLMPGDTMPAYSSPDFPPLHHAPFAQHALWVSRYRDGELYASGDYPNQGEPGQGLPEYTAAGESVDGEDLVVWHTVGMVHQPMPEQYPVMTTHRVGSAPAERVLLHRTPTLDAPSTASDPRRDPSGRSGPARHRRSSVGST